MDMKLHLQDSTLASSWQLSHRDGTDESANSKYLLSVRFTVGSTKCQYLGKVLSQNLWYDYAPWRFQTKFLMIAPYHRESTLSFGSLVFTYCICTWVVIIHPIMGLLLDLIPIPKHPGHQWFFDHGSFGMAPFQNFFMVYGHTSPKSTRFCKWSKLCVVFTKRKKQQPAVSSWLFHPKVRMDSGSNPKKKIRTCFPWVRCKVDNSTSPLLNAKINGARSTRRDDRFNCSAVKFSQCSILFLSATWTSSNQIVDLQFLSFTLVSERNLSHANEESTGHDKLGMYMFVFL